MKGIHIVILDALTMGTGEELKEFSAFGEVSTHSTTQPHERIERLQGFQVALVNKVIIDRQVMEQCPDLRLICITATGMNNVDLDAARENNIEVRNVAGYSTRSVCQSVFSMLLYLLHQTRYYDDYVRTGKYAESGIFTHHGPEFWELNGKTFGIIGLGTIGKQVAAVARAFGMEVVYYSTSGKNTDTTYKQVTLKELLQSSDVVSIHCPLNDKTMSLIGNTEISWMKPSSYLINTGRGKIVDEKALALAIDNDTIAGAALDVLEQEPIQANNPLLGVKNTSHLLITPHIAWTSKEARQTLMQGVYANISEWLSKK